MKKRVVILMIMGILLLPQIAKAQGALHSFELAFSPGILFGDTTLRTATANSEMNLGFILTGRADYFFQDKLGIEVNISVSSNNVDFNSPGLSIDMDSGQYHFDAGPIIKYPINNNLETFFYLGLGFVAIAMDDPIPGVATDDNTTQFKINLGGGFKYFVNHNMGLRFDLRDHIVFVSDEQFWGVGAEDFLHLVEISVGIFYNFF